MDRSRLFFGAGIGFAGIILLAGFGAAQDKPPPSECLAIAQSVPRVMFASLSRVAAEKSAVTITYAGHSTYLVETPGNVTIATDFSGAYTAGKSPNVVTMNRAHSTHYTLNPDPGIAHVLHGWGEGGQPARHATMIGDVLIRNVTTDIRAYRFDSEALQKDGNSIFIFEVAGLCIGHLGHLHHPLDETHYAAIGRLDIVMVPIDGTFTLSLDGMSEITRRLRSSIVLPMHRFATPLSDFIARMHGQFEMDIRPERSLTVSRDTLPKKPTVIILDGV
jgi:L-ascorbate metabolism protein UlaG (beta-lactamase superfamily)